MNGDLTAGIVAIDMDYQEKYFEEIKDHLKGLQKQITCLQKDMNEIKGRFKYLYGLAAGIALIGSFLVDILKKKFFG